MLQAIIAVLTFLLYGPAPTGEVSYAIAPLLLAGGMALAGGLGGALMSRKSRAEKEQEALLRGAATDERTRGKRLDYQYDNSRSRYLNQLDEFDPERYLAGETAAIGEDITEDFNTADLDRRTMLNDRGFLGANLGAGHLNREIAKRIARESARMSTVAGGMQMRKIGAYGDVASEDRGYAEDSRGRYLDLVSGNSDRATASRNDRNAAIMGGASLGLGLYRGTR